VGSTAFGGGSSAAFTSQVLNYLNNGGGVVTEWDAYQWLFSGTHPTIRPGAPPATYSNLFAGTVGAGIS
jgi:hypothetical protein